MTWEIFHNRILSGIKNCVWSGPQTQPKRSTLGFSSIRLLGQVSWDLTVSLHILKKKILQAVLGSLLSTFSTLSHLTPPRTSLRWKLPISTGLRWKEDWLAPVAAEFSSRFSFSRRWIQEPNSVVWIPFPSRHLEIETFVPLFTVPRGILHAMAHMTAYNEMNLNLLVKPARTDSLNN